MDSIIENFRQSLNEILSMYDMDSVQFGKELGVDPSVIRRWRNKDVDVRFKTLIKLADHFKCSIEYLCGKTHEYEEVAACKEYPDFGEQLLCIMRRFNVKPCQLFKDTAIIPSKYYYWINGGKPSLTSLVMLSEYLNVSLDYLVGRHIAELKYL